MPKHVERFRNRVDDASRKLSRVSRPSAELNDREFVAAESGDSIGAVHRYLQALGYGTKQRVSDRMP
jgi:hypothetical protein